MGNLRDQLKKANLLSAKDSKRLAHQERIERTEKGREGLEQEAEQRRRELEQMQAQDRDRTAKLQLEQQRQAERDAERAAVLELLAREAHQAGPGTVKWYFATDDGHLPWLELSPREAQELRAGMLCVIQHGPTGTHDYRLLATEHARRVARLFPERIVHAPRHVLQG